MLTGGNGIATLNGSSPTVPPVTRPPFPAWCRAGAAEQQGGLSPGRGCRRSGRGEAVLFQAGRTFIRITYHGAADAAPGEVGRYAGRTGASVTRPRPAAPPYGWRGITLAMPAQLRPPPANAGRGRRETRLPENEAGIGIHSPCVAGGVRNVADRLEAVAASGVRQKIKCGQARSDLPRLRAATSGPRRSPSSIAYSAG